MEVTVNSIMMAVQGLAMATNRIEMIEGKPTPIPRELPSKLSYRLSRLEAKLSAPKKSFEKVRMELFEKHGKKTGDAGKEEWNVEADKMEVFTQEINALTEVKEKVDFDPISISLFEDIAMPKGFFDLMGEFVKD